MSFYGGRPGQSFTISRVFANFVEMYREAEDSGSTPSSLYYSDHVPVGSFVLIAYGLGNQSTFADSLQELEQTEAYIKNRQAELDWFKTEEGQKVGLVRTAADYNATVWWNMPWAESQDYNGSVWVKCYSKEKNAYYYAYVANIGGIFPAIIDGQWVIGGVNSGIRAEGRQVEFKAFYDEELATYAFLTYTAPEEAAVMTLAEGGTEEGSETEGEAPRPSQYGLSNLSDRYSLNPVTGNYDWDEEGEFILVYEADSKGRYQYDENGAWKELGYFTLEDWDSVIYPQENNFSSDMLRWRYQDEETWHDLFEVTDLTNIKNYMLSALEASQSAEQTKANIEEIKSEIDGTKETIDQVAEDTTQWIADAKGAAANANTAVNELKEIINNLPAGEELTNVDYLAGLIENAKGNFATIDQRLDAMPYQFNLIKDMRSCTSLERGDKAFTFGKDEVGDDDSKLFQIFDPTNEEDKAKLEETDESLVSIYNPEGLKIDETYTIGTTGLIAGKLTVFSGKGSGGGGGGTIPTLSSSLTSVTVQSGQTVTIDWYWTSANGGNGTIYIKDSMSNAAIVDVADSNKNYTAGVTTKRGANESFVWKPTDGIHKLTMYVVDGGGIPTNNVEIDITVGGLAYTGTPADGLKYSTDAVINLSYKFSTIYKTDKVILHYDVYNDNVPRPELSGEKESDFAAGNQTITITLKTRDTDIGVGVFKVVTYAYMKSSPDVQTKALTCNFIIAEANKIYLTTTFDTTATEVYANKAFFIPLTLTYSGGSAFTIVGKYSDQPGVTQENGLDLGVAEDVTVGKTIQFPARFTESGTYYLKFYASGVGISATGESEEIVVEVGAENKQYLLQRRNELLLNLSADEGQTNKNNRGTWENTVVAAGEKVYRCNLTDFNYYANGWSTDSNGIPEGWLLFNSKAYARIIAPILETTRIPQNGFTLECVFKVNDIGIDAPILDWTIGVPGKGFYIYKDRAFINLPEAGVKNLTVYYEAHGISTNSEAIHIAFVLDSINKYAKIYLNGVLSGASELNYSELTDGKYASFSNIYLNCNNENDLSKIIYGNCKVAAVRLYSAALESDELVKNYIYNLQDEILQRTLWSKAGFIEKEGAELQLPPTDGSIPYMKFYLTKRNWEIMTKDKKVPVRIEYYEKGSTSPITWYDVKTSWQGTSSIAYPVKNFKLKLQKDLDGKKQKYRLDKEYGKKEKVFCLKADYMDPSHIHNTGNANFIHNSGLFSRYTLTAAQASECGLGPDDKWVLPTEKAPKSLATRTTIYGYPILLFICLESEETANLSADELIDKYKSPTLDLKGQLNDQEQKISAFKNTPEENLTDEQKAAIARYNELKASYESAKARDNINLRIYEPDKFWGIYNFNLDKGSNSSWGLYREDDYENYDMSDCTSFEVAANSAYSAGGFRALKFIKRIGAEDYAWTRPYVYFDLNGNVDTVNQKYWSITRCNADGSMNDSIVQLTDTFNGDSYTCYYNKKLQISGYAKDGVRYSYNESTGLYDENPTGTYMKLYEMDNITFKLKIVDDKLVPYSDYFEYNESDWSLDVAVVYTEVVDLTKWEIVPELPPNKDYYYNYYITDLELRFPDMDLYLFNDNGKEKYNKLMYKEYDKIIALVDYVDSYRNATTVNADGTTFLNTLSNHFDKDGLMNYYLFVMSVGLIDNFGKNMMMDTWGFDKNHRHPYRTKVIDGVTYHQVYRYLGTWNSDEEYYEGQDEFEYGLLDLSNPSLNDDGTSSYTIYKSDANYSVLNEVYDTVVAKRGIGTETIWQGIMNGDEQKEGWVHEIYEDQLVWGPHCYDLDSCLSSDNSGNLVFTPSIEMEDKSYILATDESVEVKAPPFNTSSSSLWSKIANGLSAELGRRFIELQSNVLTTDNFYTAYYTNAIETLGQRWYNGDAIPKYLSREDIKVVVNNQVQTRKPIEFINLARGTEWQRTYKWLRHRLAYLGSMYDREGTESYTTGLEPRGANTGVTYTFELQLYEPMYMKIIGKNNTVSWVRSNRYNDTVRITAPGLNDAPDQEMYILPATNLKSFKEVNGYGYSTFKQNSANRLLEIDLSGSSELKAWNRATDIDPSKNLVQIINLNGCTSLTGNTATIMGKDYPLLKEIDIRNSGAVFNFNNGNDSTDEGGGIIINAYLNHSVTSLNVKNHFELENLLVQLRYEESIQNEAMVQSGHSTRIGSVNIENCPNVKLSLQYLIKNGSNYIAPTEIEQKYIKNFINNVGPYALFQDINRFVIVNSLAVEPNENGVKELKLSLSQANLVSINGCDVTKVAFIANQYNLFGTTMYASYPGTGGDPATSDSSYQGAGADGLNCDENITEVEIRNIPGSTTEFRFPWRVHLGTLNKLERLLLNVTSIYPKLYNQDSFTTTSSAEMLGITGKEYVAPKRFELILPSANDNPNFKELYINPSVSTVNFTCVRQPEYTVGYYNNVPDALRKNLVNSTRYFSGIDIRGYSALIINFKGFKKITGILGMDSIDVAGTASKYGSTIFEKYFGDCQELTELYKYEGAANIVWNFETWSSGNNAKQFTTLSRMFQNCYKLKNTYIQGWKNLNATNLTDASYMFDNCRSIESAENWNWYAPALETVEGMFNYCSITDESTGNISGLSSAAIRFYGGDNLINISRMFKGCKNLRLTVSNPLPVQIYEGSEKDGHFNTSNVETMDELFYECVNMNGLSFLEDPNDGNWDFSSLRSAKNLFGKCTSLIEVKFPDKANFAKATDLSSMFQDCINLKSVFNHSDGFQPILYDETVSKSTLTLENFFANCNALEDIGSFALVDMTRVNNFARMFNNAKMLRGSGVGAAASSMSKNILDLTAWVTSDINPNNNSKYFGKNLNSMFEGCESLVGILFPTINYVTSFDNLLKSCRMLQSIDLTPLGLATLVDGTPVANIGIKSLNGIFQDCVKLTTISGYQDWNVRGVTTFSKLFAGCQSLSELDLRNWRLSSAASSTAGMFDSCTNLTMIRGLRDIVGTESTYKKDQVKLSDVEGMFRNCYKLNLGRSDLYSNYDTEYRCDLRHWNYALSTVKTFKDLFNGCKEMKSIESVFSYGSSIQPYVGENSTLFVNLTSFESMFAYCYGLTEITYLSKLHVVPGKITSIASLAANCSNLVTLNWNPTGGNFSNFNVDGLSNFAYNCPKLTSITLIASKDLKKNIDVDDLGISGIYSNWAGLMDMFATNVCYDFSTGNPPNTDLGEGLILGPGKNSAAGIAAKEAYLNTELNTMGWSLQLL